MFTYMVRFFKCTGIGKRGKLFLTSIDDIGFCNPCKWLAKILIYEIFREKFNASCACEQSGAHS